MPPHTLKRTDGLVHYLVALQLLLLASTAAYAQTRIKGTVVDATNAQALPFSTVKHQGSSEGIITDINGRFIIQSDKNISKISISHVGYQSVTVPATGIDTIYLDPMQNTMNEVVIKPPFDKIKYILNKTIDNRPKHNPELYDLYQCHIYYKMKVDVLPTKEAAKEDSAIIQFSDTSHLLLTESYTKRFYKRPQQTQDIVLASRFSGLKKSLFTSMVTDILPFHVYGNFIELNGVEYSNPVSPGWQSRYDFDLADELTTGDDTTFILNFRPKKNVAFNSLRGTVFINTNGYAISHLIAYSSDTATNTRHAKMEQIYKFVNGRWFPAELNYELKFKKFPDPTIGMAITGHSIIDSVLFTKTEDFKIDKTRSIKLDTRMDERTPEEWAAYRMEPLSTKEQTTYHIIDSMGKEHNFDQIANIAGKAATGRIPIKWVDIDFNRLFAYNTYEGTRLGLGLYTNDDLSRHFSIGGWFGYGFKDKVWKYGTSLRVFPGREKDNWLEAACQRNYQNSGSIIIHKELDHNGLRNWLLARVDEIREVSGRAHGRFGYWELEAQGKWQELRPQYSYLFKGDNRLRTPFKLNEAGINIRYAYSERRTPVFGTYLPLETKYPILYLSASTGHISALHYKADYIKAIASLTYHTHTNRWGKDNFRVDAGIVHTLDDKALPRSFLMAGNGFRMESNLQLYGFGGFITMLPFEYFSDKYASLMYRHDFDRSFYQHKYSKPFLSLAHNMLWGSLNNVNESANAGIKAPYKGYQESGIILNQLLRIEYMNIAYVNLNVGAFYHWQPELDLKRDARIALGISANF